MIHYIDFTNAFIINADIDVSVVGGINNARPCDFV